jgi:hypothetical protein
VIVKVGGQAVDEVGRCTQHTIHGHRGRKATRTDLLIDNQQQRLEALFALEQHVEVEATWGIYEQMIAAYREPDWANGREESTS